MFLQFRTFVMCLLGFSGFFRFSELSNIRICDIKWENAHIEINIPKSKTDIYRRGNSVIIAKTGNNLCPVFWLNKYIDLLGLEKISEDDLFTAVNYLKSQNVYKTSNKSKPLSYTRAREILLSSLKEIDLDSSKFALHSLGSGGVTAAANKNVSDRLLKIHGRWVTDNAKDGYIKDSIEQKLLVSMNLGLCNFCIIVTLYSFVYAICNERTNPKKSVIVFQQISQENIYFRRSETREKINLFLYVINFVYFR